MLSTCRFHLLGHSSTLKESTGFVFAGVLLLLGLAGTPWCAAAGVDKVLRVTFPTDPTGFDPVKVSDAYSITVIEGIFDPLLTYDYLARPATLVANVAESLPLVTDGGTTYTLKIRPGVYFADDPAFSGRKREVTAADYAYAIKRFLDPANRSPYVWLFEGKIAGLDELAQRAKKTGRFDYAASVPGLETPDRYTLRIRLTQPDFTFSYVLAFPIAGAVAREVIEAYRNDTQIHPVGSGPYRLASYARSSKIVLEANPGYRARIWNFDSGGDAIDEAIAARMRGKKLPQIHRVEISIIRETQSRWLAFVGGETDVESQLGEVSPLFLTPDGRLRPEFAARGIRLDRSLELGIGYVYLNTQKVIDGQPNPVGGFTKDKLALRRAIAMAYNVDARIRILRNGQAVRAQFPIPPGVAGHDPQYRSSTPYSPALANALLDRFRYRIGSDGYRTLPDGKPLVIRYFSGPTARDRQFEELMKHSLDSIRVRFESRKTQFSELLKLADSCRIMLSSAAWNADYPDGDNFMQLLYGGNVGKSNSACYRSPQYDRRYEETRRLPDGPGRNRLYREMARLIEVDGVWILADTIYHNALLQPHVLGYKRHPVLNSEWVYLDLAPKGGS